MNYFLEEVGVCKSPAEYLDELHIKYPIGIPYLKLLECVRFYINNKSRLDKSALNKWQAFLLLIKEIENSIPRYSYYNSNGTIDNHTKWLERAFRNFLRPFLEETEVKNSDFGQEKKLEFYKAKETLHDIFHYGKGKGYADLISGITGKKYDVKHNHVDTNTAHDANSLINYQENGTCLVCNIEDLKAGKSVIYSLEEYFDCRSVTDILASYGLTTDLFRLTQKDLEQLLDFKS